MNSNVVKSFLGEFVEGISLFYILLSMIFFTIPENIKTAAKNGKLVTMYDN